MKYRPRLVEAVLLRLVYYIAETLYYPIYKTDPRSAVNRIMVFDTGEGSQSGLAEYSARFGTMNPEFPFSLYKPGITIPRQEGNTQIAALGLEYSYCEEIDKHIQTYPVEMEVQFLHFYDNAPDSRAALNILLADNSSLSRIFVPLQVFGIDIVIPVSFSYDVGEGDFYTKTASYDLSGRIWDLTNTITLQFYEIYFRDADAGVDSIIVNSDNASIEITILEVVVESTFPSNGADTLPLNTPITVVFNTELIPDSVRYSVTGDVVTNATFSGKTLTINPVGGWQAKTKYEVTIKQGAKTSTGAYLQQDYVFEFFTA